MRANRPLSLLLLLTVSLQVAGCTAARQVGLPGDGDPDLPDVEAGMAVTVHLRDGDQRSGEVVSIDADVLVITEAANLGGEEITIPTADIASIVVRESTKFANVAVPVVGVAYLLLATVVGIMFSQMGGD